MISSIAVIHGLHVILNKLNPHYNTILDWGSYVSLKIIIVYGYITIYVMLVISLNDISLITHTTERDYYCLPVNTVYSPNITIIS